MVGGAEEGRKLCMVKKGKVEGEAEGRKKALHDKKKDMVRKEEGQRKEENSA